ncbi:TonB-dependent receptor plug domain-containing protein [Desulfospira joergensenii]|uniref:TonB-dependent receptor plug domain-containing protein n=1 Tax=Desulfospira joergensenii TaxID=53329 RepID=UPI001ABEFBC5|nr:TonB-dependent receptor [Desulfospira joergensenii]
MHSAAAQDQATRAPDRIVTRADETGDEKELEDLLHILDKYTELATKSKLNADFVPGMVTVLNGDDLQARGVQFVWEALNLVPGIETSIISGGSIDIVARGVGKTGAGGHIKYQVNGIAMNTAQLGQAWMVPYLPIAQVDRIEVIVGPGSAVHGGYAYAGVVNVITKKGQNKITGSVGSYRSFMGTGIWSFSEPEKDLSLSINLAWANSDGADTGSGEDTAYNLGMADISSAPGPANEVQRERTGMLEFALKDFSVSAYYLEHGFGDHFGFGSFLPPPDNGIKFQFKNYGAQVQQEFNPVSGLEVALSLGYLEHEYATSNMVFAPAGYAGIYTDGMIVQPYYRESRIDGGIDLNWEGFDRHTLILDYSFSKIEVEEIWHETNFIPSTGAPISSMTRFSGSESWMDENIDRFRNSITLQDEIEVGPAVGITAGLRFDYYDDVGSDLSPRLAVVWRATDNHIFKTQYAHAFRPPTFNQMYTKNNPILLGNKDIDSETVDTYELGYIYRSTGHVSRITVFYSDLENLIVSDPVAGTYVNSDESTDIKGVEYSLEQRLGSHLKLDGTLSYVDADTTLDGTTSIIANWLGNIGLLYEYSPDIIFNLQGRYVGDRNREPLDTRDDLNAYFTMDTTGTFNNLWISGLTLRMGVKNIFDADVRDPAVTTFDFSGNVVPTYAQDYPRPGRRWWMSLSYEF